MIRLRRSSLEPRLEMTPLLDVIFLLLTFFIYSQVLMTRPYTLPVKLPTLATGAVAKPTDVWGITLDAEGRVYLNEKPIAMADLRDRLREVGVQPDRPAIFLAMADETGRTDRLPTFVQLMDLIRAAGIDEYNIVAQPPGNGPPD